MTAAKLTTRGRMTIPKAVRELLRIVPGSSVTFDVIAPGRVVMRPLTARVRRRNPLAKLRGTATVRMSTDEIMALFRPR